MGSEIQFFPHQKHLARNDVVDFEAKQVLHNGPSNKSGTSKKKRKHVDPFGEHLARGDDPLATKYITTTGENDILLGRGKSAINYIGNKRYRELIKTRKDEYAACTRTYIKELIAREILDEITHRGGRFLELVSTSEIKSDEPTLANGKEKVWIVADLTKTITKIKQTLRDREYVRPTSHTRESHEPNAEGSSAGPFNANNQEKVCRSTELSISGVSEQNPGAPSSINKNDAQLYCLQLQQLQDQKRLVIARAQQIQMLLQQRCIQPQSLVGLHSLATLVNHHSGSLPGLLSVYPPRNTVFASQPSSFDNQSRHQEFLQSLSGLRDNSFLRNTVAEQHAHSMLSFQPVNDSIIQNLGPNGRAGYTTISSTASSGILGPSAQMIGPQHVRLMSQLLMQDGMRSVLGAGPLSNIFNEAQQRLKASEERNEL